MSTAFTYPAFSPAELHTPASVLRNYREFLVSQLSAPDQRKQLKILCLGVAGLRDADAAVLNAGHSFTVLDEDPWRIAACRQEYSSSSVRYVEGLLDDPGFVLTGEFDFIYNLNGLAARSNRDAAFLIGRVAEVLAPEGRALLCSFTPEWVSLHTAVGCAVVRPVVLRDNTELAELVADLGADAIRGHAIWPDDSGALAYLEIAK